MTMMKRWNAGEFVFHSDVNNNFDQVARLQPSNLTGLGFKGDGISDDAPSIQAAINATTGNLEIVFPPGVIRLGSTIQTPGNRTITITGSKKGTILQWDANVTIGWNHGFGTAGAGGFHIRNLVLLPTTNMTGICIRASFRPLSDPCQSMFSADDVQIGGTGYDPQWHGGIALYGAWNSDINNCYIFQNINPPDPDSFGLLYTTAEGVSNVAGVATALTCSNLFFQGGYIAIHLVGDVQGINIVNGNFTGQIIGIKWDAGPDDGSGTLQVSNNQFTCSTRGLLMNGGSNLMASNNLFIQFDQFNPAVASTFSAIELVNHPRAVIVGNHIVNPGGNIVSNVACILSRSTIASGQSVGLIANNTIYTQCVSPVELRGTVLGVSVVGNDFWTYNPATPAACLVVQTPAPAWAASTLYLPYSAVVNAGVTWATTNGGTSGGVGPTTNALINNTFTDGSVVWSNSGVSLASYPNACDNRIYGAGNISTDAGDNLTIGRGLPGRHVRIRGANVFTDGGLDVGMGGSMGYLDLHSGTVPILNDYDSRIQVTGGTQGVDGKGDLGLSAGSVSILSNALAADTGMDFGSPGKAGFVDLHSATMPIGNDYDARIIVGNGVIGTSGHGDLSIKSQALVIEAGYLGFYSVSPPVAKQVVTGSWASGAAGQSLAAALAAMGLITNQTTP